MTWEMMPNPGRIKMYTSGWPKNQKRCWNRSRSPPPSGEKKEVLKLRSVRSMVIAPANTGRAIRRRRTVMATDQANRGMRSRVIPGARAWKMVTRKLTAPAMEEAPAR